jgi:hypothetical protein
MTNQKPEGKYPVPLLPLLLIFLISSFSCGVEEFLPPDYLRPVSEVKAYPGDNQLVVSFKSQNTESKFDGFNLYISRSSSLRGQNLAPVRNNDTLPTLVSSAAAIALNDSVSIQVDKDADGVPIQNGITYFLAIRAHNVDAFESDLSMEVSTTPRIQCVTQVHLVLSNGFSLKNNSTTPPWDIKLVEWESSLHLAPVDCQLKDEGYYPDWKLVNKVQDSGFAPVNAYLKVYVGHVYLLKTLDNRFGKIHVLGTTANAISFFWAFQSVPGNRDI